jgi:BON domain
MGRLREFARDRSRAPARRVLMGVAVRRLTRAAPARAHSTRRWVATTAGALALGIALEFFFDPRSGKRRRSLVRDRARGAVRRRRRRIERQAHYEAGKVVGLAHAIAHRDHGTKDLDDVGLVRKVESELFRDRTLPKGQISINADRGIVVLRGQLDDEDEIHRIERATRKIAGVRDVENLLHMPGVAAPASRPHGSPRETRHST